MQRACIVLPTFNEADNVRDLVPRIFDEVERITTHEVHVLVVDDASPDRTADAVRELMARHPRLHLLTGERRGLGVAYQRGFAFALDRLDVASVVQMDADLQHPPTLLPLFLHLAAHGYGLVIGSRFAPGGATPRFSWRRRLLSRVANALVRTLGGLPRLHDFTSGFRCIDAGALRGCELAGLSTRGYAFQTSLLSELLRSGVRPIEVPMTFGERRYGRSKLTWRDQLEFLGNVLRLRFRRFAAWVRRTVARARGVASGRRPVPARRAAPLTARSERRPTSPAPPSLTLPPQGGGKGGGNAQRGVA